jgi:hypothetical protein
MVNQLNRDQRGGRVTSPKVSDPLTMPAPLICVEVSR